MASFLNLQRFAVVALFAIGVSVAGAQTTGGKEKVSAQDAKSSAAAAAKDRAKSGPTGQGLRDLINELKQDREKMIADHTALAKQLKDATEQEKKAIKEKMERQMKAFEERQATLHKQLRDEQRRQRTVQPPKR